MNATNYSALATALCGRPLSVTLVDDLNTYTTNTTVYLSTEFTGLQRYYCIISQALLLRGGAFSPVLLAKLISRKNLQLRFMLLEIIRVCDAHPWLLPRGFLQLEAIAGCQKIPANRNDSLMMAQSSFVLPPCPAFFGVFKPHMHLVASMDNHFSNQAINDGFNAKQQSVNNALNENKDKIEEGETSRFLKLLSNTSGQNGLAQSLFEKLFGAGGGKQKKEYEGAGGELDIGRIEATDKKGRFAKLADIVGLSEPKKSAANSVCSFHYPEWNVTKNSYRADWTTVYELEPWRDNPQEVKQSLMAASPELLRQLSGIGLDYQWHAGEEHGDELIIDKLVDMRIATLADNPLDPNIYRAARRTRRDLGVMILLDVSGSAAESDGYDEPVHMKQCRLAYELLDAFTRVGDQAALYGFHSWGRNMVRLLRLKSFNEYLGSQVLNRFEQLEPSAYTRMGAALRHGAKVLLEQTRLPHRLLIVVSDGFPYDDGYEGAYAEADTAKALDEIREQGTGCLCLSIGSSQDVERLKVVFGSSAVLSVDDANDFLVNIRPVLLNALKVS